MAATGIFQNAKMKERGPTVLKATNRPTIAVLMLVSLAVLTNRHAMLKF